ncbi:hypothetical protein [Mesorhizobium sp. M7A.F.Ca.US.010.02.1.1]|uniref:hypothetical protein n=1 Tax=unclassified Mesorhizobium TaxID=325217 RepID=UPI0013E34BCE|nr:hypothetical protein [Mesorhizobium sp. M7A.F.Ca.US.010.02.1.1]
MKKHASADPGIKVGLSLCGKLEAASFVSAKVRCGFEKDSRAPFATFEGTSPPRALRGV